MENCSSQASRENAQETRERLARERGYNLTARTTSASTTATIAVPVDDRTEVETANPATIPVLQSSDDEEEGATAVGSTDDDNVDIDNADASSTIASADDDVAG